MFLVAENIKSTTLHTEKAILLGRTGEHSQALQVLVHQEQDFEAAEAYCCRAAQGQGTEFRHSLLLTLLKIYLTSNNLTNNAVDLLNNNPQVFTLEKVIQLLPDSWSVQLVSQYLVGSVRETFHRRRMAMLQKALAQAELMRHKVTWVSLITYSTFCTAVNIVCILVSHLLNPVGLSLAPPQMQTSKTKVRLDKQQKCTVCQRELTEPQFARAMHGEVMHTTCTE